MILTKIANLLIQRRKNPKVSFDMCCSFKKKKSFIIIIKKIGDFESL